MQLDFRFIFVKNTNLMQRFILTVLLLLATLTGFAQQINVTGVVKDAATGETVIGASVLIKGTTTGTVTSLDGEFSINVSCRHWDTKLMLSSLQKQVAW